MKKVVSFKRGTGKFYAILKKNYFLYQLRSYGGMKNVAIPNYVDFVLIPGNSHYFTSARDKFGFNEGNFVIGIISLVAADKIVLTS